jgi:hypothetical protein
VARACRSSDHSEASERAPADQPRQGPRPSYAPSGKRKRPHWLAQSVLPKSYPSESLRIARIREDPCSAAAPCMRVAWVICWRVGPLLHWAGSYNIDFSLVACGKNPGKQAKDPRPVPHTSALPCLWPVQVETAMALRSCHQPPGQSSSAAGCVSLCLGRSDRWCALHISVSVFQRPRAKAA